MIEASAVSFQVSQERSKSQDDDGAEPWELDIASERSISRTSIKCDGDRSRADSDIGKEEPCRGIKVRSRSSPRIGPDFVAGFMNEDQTMANLPVYADGQKQSSDRRAGQKRCIDPKVRNSSSETNLKIKKRKMDSLPHPSLALDPTPAVPQVFAPVVSCQDRIEIKNQGRPTAVCWVDNAVWPHSVPELTPFFLNRMHLYMERRMGCLKIEKLGHIGCGNV